MPQSTPVLTVHLGTAESSILSNTQSAIFIVWSLCTCHNSTSPLKYLYYSFTMLTCILCNHLHFIIILLSTYFIIFLKPYLAVHGESEAYKFTIPTLPSLQDGCNHVVQISILMTKKISMLKEFHCRIQILFTQCFYPVHQHQRLR